jgi:cell wall-associated NlpC family hydrolase
MKGTRRRRLAVAVSIALALLIVGLAVWHWYPRTAPKATAAMREAMQGLPRDVYVSPQPPAPDAQPTTERERLVTAAWKLIGVPYAYGAKGPDKLDCSGFTKAAYGTIGVSLPDGSYNQARGEQPLAAIAGLVPGDLLFYRWAKSASVSHVTMYLGDGWVIGTGTPGQPPKMAAYPITYDLRDDGRVITYRRITLPDEIPGSTVSG